MPISTKTLHQTLACLPAVFNHFLIGIGIGWIAPTLPKLTEKDSAPVLQINTDQISWLAAVNEVGKILGSIVSPFITDNFGRKYAFVLITILYSVAWWSVKFATHIYILYVARIVFGLANGMDDVVVAIYTSENCSPNIRGIMGSVVFISLFAGQLVEFVVATYLSYTGTAIVNMVMAACVFFALFFVTETPYFLVMKGKREEAKKNLIWLRGNVSPTEVAEELHKIELSISEEKMKKRSLKSLFSSTDNMKGIILVVGMSTLAPATGAMVFSSYASLIFSRSELLTANEYTILYGVMPFVGLICSLFITEKVNRRSMAIGCNIGFTFSNICSYLLIYMHNNGYEMKHYPWLIFGSISAYCIFSALFQPTGYALRAELLPYSVRAIGCSIAGLGYSISNFCNTKMFISIRENAGMETNFIFTPS